MDGRSPSGNGHGDRSELDRLPPPAFPPGTRSTHRRGVRIETGAGDAGVPDDAFISPDEPIVRTGTRMASDAFISPDEPIAPRDPYDLGEEISPDDVVVTGIGDDPHLSPDDIPRETYDDPNVAEIVRQVGKLADALRDRGEAGLKTTADMSRFEATLRAYCVGYLAAKRDAGSQ